MTAQFCFCGALSGEWFGGRGCGERRWWLGGEKLDGESLISEVCFSIKVSGCRGVGRLERILR